MNKRKRGRTIVQFVYILKFVVAELSFSSIPALVSSMAKIMISCGCPFI